MNKKALIQKRSRLRLILSVMLLLLSVACMLCVSLFGKRLPDQRAALSWDSSGGARQLSAFLSDSADLTPDRLIAQRRSIDTALADAGLTAPNENARLWIDAYSADGELTLTTARTAREMRVIGVGGEFFYFHPYKLVCGSFFGAQDLSRNRIVLDETAAWQLFGAIEVAGMPLSIGEKEYTVAGVIQNETDPIVKEMCNGTPIVIVPFESLGDQPITCYEAILPEAVKGLALTTFSNSFTIDKSLFQLRENSLRYRFLQLLAALPDFAFRTVQAKPILYPYWENAALCVENYALLFTAAVLFFAAYPLMYFTCLAITRWRRRKWHLSDLRRWIAGRIDARNARAYYKKRQADQPDDFGGQI